MFIQNCQLQNLAGSFYSSGRVLFHPQRNLLYSPVGNRIKQVDLEHNTTMVLQFECRHNIKHLAIDPQGNTMLAVDNEGYAIIYNLVGAFVVAHFNFKGKVQAICFSPCGKLLAVGVDNGFRVYEAPPLRRSFEPLLLIKKYKSRHTAKITSLRFSPDSRFLITGGDDNKVFLNNVLSVPDYVALSFDVHRFRLVDCFFDQEMRFMYTCDRGGNIYVWKWVTDIISDEYKRHKASKKAKLDRQRNHGQTVKDENEQIKEELEDTLLNSLELYSPFEQAVSQGRFILSKKLVISHPGCYVKAVTFLPGMSMLASCYSNGKFSVWKLEEDILEQVHTFSVGEHKINSLSVSAGGNWLALAIKELGQLIVWEWKSQSFIFNQSGLLHQTSCLAWNPAATVLAAGSNDGRIKLWEQRSGFCFATFTEHESEVTAVKFTNQNTLISSSNDGTVRAYDCTKYRCFRTMRPDNKCQLSCLAVEPSGEVVCAGSLDPYEVYCWNLQTGNMLQVLTGHKGPISCIAFVGERFVTGSWDRTIRIHDFYAKRGNADTLDQSSEITAMAASPNAKHIAVCTFKGEIYIWDATSSEVVAIIDCKKDLQSGRKTQSSISADNDQNSRIVRTLQYSSCGEFLIAAGRCKHVLLYDIKHRLLLKKFPLTCNRDIDGVIDWLNSRNIKEGMNLNELERESESDQQRKDYLPGARKLDVSKRSKKMELSVCGLVMADRHLAVATNFGVLVYGPSNRVCFSPYELLPKLTPSMLPELIEQCQYGSAVIVALKLNIPVRKLLGKLNSKHIPQICSELSKEYAGLLLQRLAEGEIDERILHWCVHLCEKVDTVPRSLQGSLGRMEEVSRLIQNNRACIGLSEIMTASR